MAEKTQHTEQQKNLRAKNIFWTAARNYDVSPQFLSFEKDGTPEFYMNTIAGLVHKWLDAQKIQAVFNGFVGTAFNPNYENYFWIALEHHLFFKESAVRPAMSHLRQDYARATVAKISKITEQWKVPIIQLVNAQRILGERPFVMLRDKSILDALEKFERDMTTDELIEEYLALLKKFYRYNPNHSTKFVRSRFNIFIKKKSATIRMTGSDDRKTFSQAKRKSLRSLLFPSHEERVYASLERAFGKSIYEKHHVWRLEHEFCTGAHAGSRLFFAGSDAPSNSFDRNKNYFREHLSLHKTAITQLARRLRNSLNTYTGDSFLNTRGGFLNANRAWRAVTLSDEVVFCKKSLDEIEPFSVDLMLDASASQLQKEKIIATQAYIIAEALTICGIPIRVFSFNNFYVFTAVHIFRDYDEALKKANANEKIFCYGASGYNRDGLALRVAGNFMKNSPAETKLLIVLSDADPNDDRNIGGKTLGDSYSGELAVADTAEEVRHLRQNGNFISAIFTGADSDLSAARKIYGNDFVRISDARQMAEAVASIIIRHIANT